MQTRPCCSIPLTIYQAAKNWYDSESQYPSVSQKCFAPRHWCKIYIVVGSKIFMCKMWIYIYIFFKSKSSGFPIVYTIKNKKWIIKALSCWSLVLKEHRTLHQLTNLSLSKYVYIYLCIYIYIHIYNVNSTHPSFSTGSAASPLPSPRARAMSCSRFAVIIIKGHSKYWTQHWNSNKTNIYIYYTYQYLYNTGSK